MEKQKGAKEIQRKLAVGAKFPDFDEKDLEGKPLSIARFKGKVVLVDFWATWCGPCRMVAPILDQLAEEYQGKVRVAKLDVDSNQKTTMRFNVRSIPAMLFFKDGKLVDQVIGAVPKTALAAKFAQHAA